MIKIEVTGTSIGEVADKLLAIGASLRSTPAAFQPAEPVKSITSTKIDPVMPELREAAEAAPVDPTPTPTAPAVEEQASSTTADTLTAAPAASASEPLNFELDVAPVVLRAVAAKGKPFVQDVLSEFGGARASDLDEALWPELVARLEAEMA